MKKTASILTRLFGGKEKKTDPYGEFDTAVKSNPQWTDEEKRMFFAAFLGKSLGESDTPPEIQKRSKKFLGFMPYIPEDAVKELYKKRYG